MIGAPSKDTDIFIMTLRMFNKNYVLYSEMLL
jgi:hypothetical protein